MAYESPKSSDKRSGKSSVAAKDWLLGWILDFDQKALTKKYHWKVITVMRSVNPKPENDKCFIYPRTSPKPKIVRYSTNENKSGYATGNK